jgi:hypothetical protein
MVDLSQLEKVKTQADIQLENDAATAKTYLRDTDWYVMRFVETQKAVPEDITAKRADARAKISLVQN